MQKEQRTVFHVGLIKTGSTFLQSQFFPKLKEVSFFHGGEDHLHGRRFLELKKIVLVSSEGMSGHPLLAYQRGRSYFEEFKTSIQNIKSLYSRPQIIVCFREPASFIQSVYKQYLHQGGTSDWADFFSLTGESSLDPADFYFSEYCEYLQEQFESPDLFIYTFDEFKTDKNLLLRQMLSFIRGHKVEVQDLPQYDSSKRSNPAVPRNLEGLLIRLNKINSFTKKKFGFKLQIKLFGKVLNQRVLCQYVLPRFIKTTSKRDLDSITLHYSQDWQKLKRSVRDLREKSLPTY